MERILAVAALPLLLLAGCATQTNSAALTAAEAVATDLVSLEQQILASDAAVTPAELSALTNAVAAAQAGVAELTSSNAQTSSVLGSITAALQQIEPFLPEIAAVIGTLAARTPSVAAIPAPAFPALARLQTDLTALRAAT